MMMSQYSDDFFERARDSQLKSDVEAMQPIKSTMSYHSGVMANAQKALETPKGSEESKEEHKKEAFPYTSPASNKEEQKVEVVKPIVP